MIFYFFNIILICLIIRKVTVLLIKQILKSKAETFEYIWIDLCFNGKCSFFPHMNSDPRSEYKSGLRSNNNCVKKNNFFYINCLIDFLSYTEKR